MGRNAIVQMTYEIIFIHLLLLYTWYEFMTPLLKTWSSWSNLLRGRVVDLIFDFLNQE